MKTVVVGLGYVGLSNAVLLSQNNEVIAVDIAQEKVQSLQSKIAPISDSLLQEYLTNYTLNLQVTNMPLDAYREAEILIICTPTNYDSEKNFFDTSSIEQVLHEFLSYNRSAIIIIKSTIPVGYTKEIKQKMGYEHIVFSPEFLREGSALYDNLYPSRIIFGLDMDNPTLVKKVEEISKLWVQIAQQETPVLLMQDIEAEAVKLFANTYLALRVSFFNELDTYAELNGLNACNIIKGVSLDKRIGDHYNNPSFGYGGYCLPKDTKQLLANFGNAPNRIIRAVVEANETRKDFITNQILKKQPKKVGVYRLTMKANSDNFRQSSVRGVIERLRENRVDIFIYEPSISADTFEAMKVIHDIDEFKSISDIIIANRKTDDLLDVAHKVYSRDIFLID